MHGTLYLIPCTLGDTPVPQVLPAYNADIIGQINYFIVENLRSARRFLRATHKTLDIDKLTFFELNKRSAEQDLPQYIQPALNGENIGLISEAGCPAIADPGANLVALAHRHQIPVIPLVGPSSIILSLMASGFNGQNFAFNGYLPIKSNEQQKAIIALERKMYSQNQSQLFIETPYRNLNLFEQLLRFCNNKTRLCIASDLTLPDAFIAVKTIAQWKKEGELPHIHKRPTIFILGQ